MSIARQHPKLMWRLLLSIFTVHAAAAIGIYVRMRIDSQHDGWLVEEIVTLYAVGLSFAWLYALERYRSYR